MGHIQYFMSYKNQSYLYRDGPNPGFHEGVADIMSLAIGKLIPKLVQLKFMYGTITSQVLQAISRGLDSSENRDDVDIEDYETDINILFNTAVTRLTFMPFGYLVDRYRWDLYKGLVDRQDINCHWHKLRLEIQGMKLRVRICHLYHEMCSQVLLLQIKEMKHNSMLGHSSMFQMITPMSDTSQLTSTNSNSIELFVLNLDNMFLETLRNHCIDATFTVGPSQYSLLLANDHVECFRKPEGR